MRGLANIPTGSGHLSADVLGRFNIDGLIRMSLLQRQPTIEAIDEFRVDSNAALFGREFTGPGKPRFPIRFDREVAELAGIRVDSAAAERFDSASPTAGLFMARQLEQILAKVLETPRPALNAEMLFPVSTEVAPGARTYTIRRFDQTGEAIIWRGGGNIPRVGLVQEEETRPVRHIASSFAFDIFDQASANFANIGLTAGLLKACRRAVGELRNRLSWYGNAASDVYGVLTYPWLAKKVAATAFDGTASPDDVIAELNAAANYAEEQSNGVFHSTTMITTPYVKNYLANTPRSSTSDKSILAWFLENNSQGITEVKTAHELKGGTGIPTGAHGILFTKSGDEDACRLEVPQPFTTLPMQQIGPDFVTIAYESFGGAVMPYAGHSLLLFVDVPATAL